MAFTGTHIFGGVHSIARNDNFDAVVNGQHTHAYVAQNNIVLGNVPVHLESPNPTVAIENRNGSWNYFFALEDGTTDYGKRANPAYHATTNPNVPQYVPLQFDNAELAQAAYDALDV